MNDEDKSDAWRERQAAVDADWELNRERAYEAQREDRAAY